VPSRSATVHFRQEADVVKTRGLVVVCLPAVLVAAACSTTEFKSTWRDPTAQQTSFQGRKVAAFVVSPNQSTRLAGEDALAGALRSHGVQGIPGYQLISAEASSDSEVLRRQLQKSGVEGAVIMRVVDRRQEVNYTPGGPYYGSMYGYWDYGWSAASAPGYVTTSNIVSVETLVYSVPQDKLLWGGVSETMDPQKLDSAVKEIVDAAANQMKKEGLIRG
jgi:hypothetical protein